MMGWQVEIMGAPVDLKHVGTQTLTPSPRTIHNFHERAVARAATCTTASGGRRAEPHIRGFIHLNANHCLPRAVAPQLFIRGLNLRHYQSSHVHERPDKVCISKSPQKSDVKWPLDLLLDESKKFATCILVQSK